MGDHITGRDVTSNNNYTLITLSQSLNNFLDTTLNVLSLGCYNNG